MSINASPVKIKSNQDRMRNDQVISVNMLFWSEISEAERPCMVALNRKVGFYRNFAFFMFYENFESKKILKNF